MRKVTKPFDCRAFGQAIKDARTRTGLTRAHVEEMYDIDARYLLAIENKGQSMSLQVLFELATIFGVSADKFFFPDAGASKSEERLRLDGLLDTLNGWELSVIESTAQALHNARTIREDYHRRGYPAAFVEKARRVNSGHAGAGRFRKKPPRITTL